MEILIFDKDYSVEKNDYLCILSNNLTSYNITLKRELSDALSFYKSSDFYVVIIDFTTIEGKEFLQEVNRLNSLQKIITIGYTLSCSSEMGCDYCIENFKKRRLIKPINSIELYKTIEEFKDINCKYANAFDKPKELLNELIQKYYYFEYDEKESIIYSNSEDIQEIKQLLNLMVDLKNYNIEYTIIDEKSVKIL